MNSCASVLLLSVFAFSECFAHRSNMAFPDHWEFHNHLMRHHNIRDFYPGLPGFRHHEDLPPFRDIYTNIVPHGPPCPHPNGHESGQRFDFDTTEDFEKYNTAFENKNERPGVRPFTEETATFRVEVPKSYIVGDFVFPDQVHTWRRPTPSDQKLIVVAGIERGKPNPVPLMEKRSNFGSGKCISGEKKIGGICVRV